MTTIVIKSPLEEEIQKLLSGNIAWFVKELNSYTPCITEKANIKRRDIDKRLYFLIEEIAKVMRKYFSRPQQIKLMQALHYASEKHKGVYRKDEKTPYFFHPLEVAVILINLGIHDFKIIIAAILHDVPEDTTKTGEESILVLKEIGLYFGAGVRNIVCLVTVPNDSIGKASYISFMRKGADIFFGENGEHIVEQMVVKPFNLVKKQQYWQAMKKEPDFNCRWRVIVLKFADRIHNIMTLAVMPPEKRKYKIEETRQEFPQLYEILKKTMYHLYAKGTLKKIKTLDIPPKLMSRLENEIGKHL